MQMQSRQERKDISILGIDKAIWKTTYLAATVIVFKNGPSIWEAEDNSYWQSTEALPMVLPERRG
jgi:hypothetical protein